MKSIYKNHITHIINNSEILNSFSPISGTSQGCSLSPFWLKDRLLLNKWLIHAQCWPCSYRVVHVSYSYSFYTTYWILLYVFVEGYKISLALSVISCLIKWEHQQGGTMLQTVYIHPSQRLNHLSCRLAKLRV